MKNLIAFYKKAKSSKSVKSDFLRKSFAALFSDQESQKIVKLYHRTALFKLADGLDPSCVEDAETYFRWLGFSESGIDPETYFEKAQREIYWIYSSGKVPEFLSFLEEAEKDFFEMRAALGKTDYVKSATIWTQ